MRVLPGGGMLGLFLLGIISRKVGNSDGIIATIVGISVILWLTFSFLIPEEFAVLRNPLHANMTIVVGTLAIFLTGTLRAKLLLKRT